jgi:hypothetical protein
MILRPSSRRCWPSNDCGRTHDVNVHEARQGPPCVPFRELDLFPTRTQDACRSGFCYTLLD